MSGKIMVAPTRTYKGIGLFGKIPARGDFLSVGVPTSFVDAAESWIRSGLLALKHKPDWQSAYLSAPIWQFSCAAGVWNENPWSGILMPSVDRVGRYFPLLVVKPCRSLSNTSLYEMQAGAQKALDPNLADMELWRTNLLKLKVEPAVERRTGLLCPPMGGVFRALDLEGQIAYEYVVSSLDADLFCQMIINTQTLGEG